MTVEKPFYDAITEFIFLEDAPQKADILFIPGSNASETVIKAAQLYSEGYAPLILPSGRYSKVSGRFPGQQFSTEWEYMRSILVEHGVPEEAVLLEDQATYTWENAIFSRKVTLEAGLDIRTAIICCQAFHARRAFTYYQQQFPQTRLLMVPAVTKGISRENWFFDKEKTAVVLGELARCGDQFRCMLPPDDPIGWP